MGNTEGGPEGPPAREAPGRPDGPRRPSDRLPAPPRDQLEERFNAVLNTMNLPPDKAKILQDYDGDKKWELICDQERFQVKSPPSAYVEKLKGHLDHGGVSRKFKRRVQESTQVLRELEISLRTNHIGWAEEFLSQENQGLDVLVEYLSVANSASTCDTDAPESVPASEDVSRRASGSPTLTLPAFKTHRNLAMRKALRNSRLAGQRDEVHLCIMCLRAIMNYQSGFNLVMTHPRCVNEITLSLNDRSPRTKALVLELLAAVCLVRGGHDIILSAFDNFREVCGEKCRFERLMEFFCHEDGSMDFMVACMQFINIVVHSVENMNFRVHLQYEFTRHGLDRFLETLRTTESERLRVQIQAYLDNVFDVAALLEDADTKATLLEHLEELQQHNSQLSSRLQDGEREAAEKVTELEKKLVQSAKEVEMMKESLRDSTSQVSLLQQRERERELELQQQRDQDQKLQELRELEVQVRGLVERGLVRMERSASGGLDLLVVQAARTQEAEREDAGGEDQVVVEEPAGATPAPPPAPPPPSPSPSPSGAPPPPPPPPLAAPGEGATAGGGGGGGGGGGWKKKQPIQTKYRLPLFNWQPLKAEQVAGTVFSELDDENILQELDMAAFEEIFKTKAQSDPVDAGTLRMKMACKTPGKVSLMETNRAKNLAITLRKEGMTASGICGAIQTYDRGALSLDFLELLERFVPTECEMQLLRGFEGAGGSLEELSQEDRFMATFSKIPRLARRIRTLTFMGNFSENVRLIQPQLDAVIAASMSIKSSGKLKKVLEMVLALGNYMNGSKRGPAYGFRLQSLDLLLDTKSTDRRQTLLHFMADGVQEKFPEVRGFYNELHFLEKAATVSLDGVLQDLRALEKGMEVTSEEFSAENGNPVLRTFVSDNGELLRSLAADGRTAQDAYNSAVEYFGENSRTTPPSIFFTLFVRFIKAYKQAEQENLQRRKHLESEVPPSPHASETPVKVQAASKAPHLDLIAELKRRQVSPLVREGKDGAIEDIITDLRNQPYRRTDGTRRSAKWNQSQQLQVSSDISL